MQVPSSRSEETDIEENRKYPLDKFYTFEKMIKGLLVAGIERTGFAPDKIAKRNVNVFIGEVKNGKSN